MPNKIVEIRTKLAANVHPSFAKMEYSSYVNEYFSNCFISEGKNFDTYYSLEGKLLGNDMEIWELEERLNL